MRNQLLSRNEVAALAQVERRQVDKAIENQVVHESGDGACRLTVAAVEVLAAVTDLDHPSVAWQRDLAAALLTDTRTRAWVTVGDGGLGFKRPDGVVARRRDAARYLELRDRHLSQDPDVMGGEPVLRGTRLPVRLLAERVDHEGEDAVAKEFCLESEVLWFSKLWAAANPRRGRRPQSKTVDLDARARNVAARRARSSASDG